MTQLRSVALAVLATGLGLAVGCGPTKPTKSDEPNGKGGGTPVPLLDLLSQLPKERWPKDENDTLKMSQAKEWYDKNLTGRRVIWSVPVDRRFEFEIDKKTGKYNVAIYCTSAQKVALFGGEWNIAVTKGGLLASESNFGFRVKGLSEAAAERLRALPHDQPLEAILTVTGVQFGEGIRLHKRVVCVWVEDNAAIKGFSE